MRAFDVELDEWQEICLESGLHERADGRWITQQVGVSAPRQNGKTHLIVARALAGALLFDEKTIIVSAHQQDTNRETFGKFVELIDNNAALQKRVKAVMNAINREKITLHNGSEIKFKARSGPGGRGFSADCLMLDEAQILSARAWASIYSTMSARPNPQIWLLGTPPTPDDEGEQFGKIRQRGIEGKTPKLAYLEWSAERTDDFDAIETWAKANPALGSRLNIDIIEGERATYSEDQFARERLGIWDNDSGGNKAIRGADWDALAVADKPEGRNVYAVRFSVDGASVALAGAIRPEVGPIHVGGIRLANMADGIQWLVDWLVERHENAAQIVIDGKAGVGYLVNALHEAKVPKSVIIVAGTDTVTSGASMVEAAINMGDITHNGKAVVDEQVKSAEKRKIGTNGGFGWQAPEGGNVALFDAVTLAYWGAKTTKRRPGRKAVFL